MYPSNFTPLLFRPHCVGSSGVDKHIRPPNFFTRNTLRLCSNSLLVDGAVMMADVEFIVDAYTCGGSESKEGVRPQ